MQPAETRAAQREPIESSNAFYMNTFIHIITCDREDDANGLSIRSGRNRTIFQLNDRRTTAASNETTTKKIFRRRRRFMLRYRRRAHVPKNTYDKTEKENDKTWIEFNWPFACDSYDEPVDVQGNVMQCAGAKLHQVGNFYCNSVAAPYLVVMCSACRQLWPARGKITTIEWFRS